MRGLQTGGVRQQIMADTGHRRDRQANVPSQKRDASGSRLPERVSSLCVPCLVFCIALGLGALCALTARDDGHVRLERRQLRESLADNAAGWLREKTGSWRLYEAQSWLHGSVQACVTGLESRASSYGRTGIREPVERGSGVREAYPLLQEADELVGFASQTRGEPLDDMGYPLRCQENAAVLEHVRRMHVREKTGQRTQPFYYVTRARGLGHKGPILVYLEAVRRCAGRYHLPVNLLLAVMQVESGGRHDLVSSRNAVGLMQVQPETAGMAVQRYLAGKKQSSGTSKEGCSAQPEADVQQVQADLADFEQNIFYGASYLHLLEKVYFRKVHDREARILCMLASYNMGPGRFTRLFAGTPAEAVRIINLYSATGLYEEIRLRFTDRPYDYLDKVITLMLQYRKMGY